MKKMRHRTWQSRRPCTQSCSTIMYSSVSLVGACTLSKALVLLSVCLALFQSHFPRVVVAVEASSSSHETPLYPPKWKDIVPADNNILDSSVLGDDGSEEELANTDLEQADDKRRNDVPNNNDESSTVPSVNDEPPVSQHNNDKKKRLNESDIQESLVDSSESLHAARNDHAEKVGVLNDDDGTVGMTTTETDRDSTNENQASGAVEDAVVSDAESEWSSSEDEEEEDGSTDESLTGITVDVTTSVKEERLNINQPQDVKRQDMPLVDDPSLENDEIEAESYEPKTPARTLAAEESESESELSEDEDEALIAADQAGGDTQPPQNQKLSVDESESETDEEEGSVAASEIDSDAETTSDWSEDDKSLSEADESDFADQAVVSSSPRLSLTVAAPLPEPPRTFASSNALKLNDGRVAPTSASAANVPLSRRKKGRKLGSPRQYGSPNDMDPSSQPLKTLEKLQHMLDETDYMTAARGSIGDGMRSEPPAVQMNPIFDKDTATVEYDQRSESLPTPNPPSTPSVSGAEASVHGDKLWTSKDRMKYKKQQQRARRAKQEQKRLQEQLRSPPVHPNSSDDEDTDDTDDGLGYTLPNLPVFFSDAEGTATDVTDTDHTSTIHQGGQLQPPLQQPPPPPFEQRPVYPYPPPPGYYPSNVPPLPDQNNMGQAPYYPPNPYGYGPYGPYHQQQQMASQYAAWAAASAGIPPYSAGRAPPYRRPYTPQANSPGLAIESRKTDTANTEEVKLHDPKPAVPEIKPEQESQSKDSLTDTTAVVQQPYPVATAFQAATPYQIAPMASTISPSSLAEASSHLSFDSIQKMSVVAIGIALLCYSAVSPRNLPPIEYNAKFDENIRIVSLMMIAPILSFLLVFDPKENDINKDVNAFYIAFTVGYGVTFLLQILFTTAIRLGVFSWLEPDVFQLTPQVPSLVLPWVLRENRYRPKRITLFAADFATSCVACPIIEEYVKLKILQWSARLPRNFKWTTRASSKNKKKKRRLAVAIPRLPGDPEVTNINAYVSQMLAVSLGIKLCDSTRRILMYTKDSDENKGFYALCRGIFPIQELCGTMTALALAKRDVLGWNMPLWKMLAPAVVIHGMANFRGMKPIFKWNSATPWSEMQLLPWNAADDSTLPQLMNKGFAKLMWLIILGRVLGYCIKNYYLIRRQAVKRTTTYAGKRAAFSAELAATEMLKKTAKDK